MYIKTGKSVEVRKKEFIERAKLIHGDKYDYSLINYINCETPIEILLNGESYFQSPTKHLMGRCPEKNTPRKTTEQFIQEAKAIWGDKYDYSLTVYNGALKPVKILFQNIIYEQRAVSHLNKLAPEKDVVYELFISRAKEKYGNKYDYSKINKDNYDYNEKMEIGYCGIFYRQAPKNHLISMPEKIIRRYSTEQFIEKSNIVHDNKYDYSKVNYQTNRDKVIIICPKHGEFLQNAGAHMIGFGCQNCYESKGESEISKFLTKNNIIFSRQHRFKNCKNIKTLPFDFYIPSMRTAIEFDGEQHFKSFELFGGDLKLEATKKNDSIKNTYCEDNFINLIRIPYHQYDNINQILWDNLKILIRQKKLK